MAIPLNLDVVGKRYGPYPTSFNWKDAVLYAIGVGAQRNELEYVYEKNLKLVPSFGATFAVATEIVYDMLARGLFGVEEAPASLLAMGNEVIVHKVPSIVDQQFKTEAYIRAVYDRGEGKGAQIEMVTETFDEAGDLVFTNISREVALENGGFGGEPAPRVAIDIPDREPDVVHRQVIPENQAVLYRLTGDLFDIHVDPEFAKKYGFDVPILHGLCTFGFSCRALVAAFIPGESERMKTISADYSKPVIPEMTLETRMWRTGDGQAVFEAANAADGGLVLRRGTFTWE